MGLRQEELRNHFGFCLERKGATTAGLNQGKLAAQDSLNFGEELSRPRAEAEASLKAPAEGLGGSCHLSTLCPDSCFGVFLNTAQGWQGAGFGAAGFGVVLAGGARQPLGRKGTSGAHFLLLSTLLLPLFFPLVPAERKTPERSPSPRRWHRSDLSRFRVGFDEHTWGLIQMSRIKQHLGGFTPFFPPAVCLFFPPPAACVLGEVPTWARRISPSSPRSETFASFFWGRFLLPKKTGGPRRRSGKPFRILS